MKEFDEFPEVEQIRMMEALVEAWPTRCSGTPIEDDLCDVIWLAICLATNSPITNDLATRVKEVLERMELVTSVAGIKSVDRIKRKIAERDKRLGLG